MLTGNARILILLSFFGGGGRLIFIFSACVSSSSASASPPPPARAVPQRPQQQSRYITASGTHSHSAAVLYLHHYNLFFCCALFSSPRPKFYFHFTLFPTARLVGLLSLPHALCRLLTTHCISWATLHSNQLCGDRTTTSGRDPFGERAGCDERCTKGSISSYPVTHCIRYLAPGHGHGYADCIATAARPLRAARAEK